MLNESILKPEKGMKASYANTVHKTQCTTKTI